MKLKYAALKAVEEIEADYQKEIEPYSTLSLDALNHAYCQIGFKKGTEYLLKVFEEKLNEKLKLLDEYPMMSERKMAIVQMKKVLVTIYGELKDEV